MNLYFVQNIYLWGAMHLVLFLPFVAAEHDRGEGGQGAGQRCWKHNLCCMSGPG